MDGQKCEHDRCNCYVDLGQTYCNERCKESDRSDGDAAPDGKCACRHADCLHR